MVRDMGMKIYQIMFNKGAFFSAFLGFGSYHCYLKNSFFSSKYLKFDNLQHIWYFQFHPGPEQDDNDILWKIADISCTAIMKLLTTCVHWRTDLYWVTGLRWRCSLISTHVHKFSHLHLQVSKTNIERKEKTHYFHALDDGSCCCLFSWR